VGIQANTPWALLLLIPWAVYIWWMYRMTIRLQGRRKMTAITTRGLIILLLIAVAADVQPYSLQKERNIMFIADRSASMGADEEMGRWIASAWAEHGAEDRSGIVSSGLNAAVERSLSAEPFLNPTSFTFKANINAQYTDLSQSLQLAGALLAKEGGGRIVLLSDGGENAGDAKRQARLLKDAGIAVDVLHIDSARSVDAAIEELKVPSVLRQGETFTFELTVTSTVQGSAQLRLYGDDTELSISEVELERGENRFVLQNVAAKPGFQSFRAELFMDGDEQPANNTAHAFSRVSGAPAVLIVEGKPGSSANIESALAASFIRHETIQPEQLSVQLASYAAYDSIILNNVPATRIAEKPMQWLGKAVSDYGVGLVMLGGDDSFGLGGYFKTPVERALPVYMDLQGKRQIPSLGLVLVIDRSGSMSDGKLELAKEAAMRTIELLRDEDTVAVVAFDSQPWWIVNPTKLTDRSSVLAAIQGITEGGGTDIYPAVEAGYKALLEIDAQRKHMILLTDGQSAGSSNYNTITTGMVDNNMTMSTVAVGDGADQALLKQLAEAAKGRYYFTKDQSTLPSIFSRETILMSRTYIVEQTFTPSIGQGGDWSMLWQNGLPAVNAYIATTAKELAETALLTPDGDPLLARWTYGSGRTVAWTTDLSGKWAKEWVDWPAFPNVLTEWIKWTFPQFESTPYSLTTVMNGSDAKLRVRTQSSSGGSADGSLAVSVQNEGDAADNAVKRLMPVGPREYEADLDIYEPGVYLAHIGELSGDGESDAVTGGTTAGFVIPYSPEYKITNADGEALMESISAITGGRMLSWDNPEQTLQFEPAVVRNAKDWTRELLMTALLLWLIDIAIRRLSLPWRIWGATLRQRLARAARQPEAGKEIPVTGSTAAVSRLKKRAAATGKFYESGGSASTQAAKPRTADSGALPREAASAASKENSFAAAAVPDSGRNTSKSAEAGAAAYRSAEWKREDAQPKGTKEATSESPATGDKTINRLLAAKNKNKR